MILLDDANKDSKSALARAYAQCALIEAKYVTFAATPTQVIREYSELLRFIMRSAK